tara:strand:+ start:45668 stop:46429 length:762 start_codon:yes stop_codon:yes gene_type:complete
MAALIEYTLSFDEKVKGFPSFYSYKPDWMGSLNNRFYSIKDGQLYQHDDTDNPIRNNFYEVQYNSEITLLDNENPSAIEVMKAINTESNKAFDFTIKGYLNDETSSITESTIASTEFLNKEGKWHAYLRRSDVTGDLTAKSAYGLGTISSINSMVITLNNPLSSSLISITDELYDVAGTLLGVITNYDISLGTVTIDAVVATAADTFVYGIKNGRIEGSENRGYNFEVKIVDTSTSRTELFAVSSQTFKSEPS